jgi:hypothetical protein
MRKATLSPPASERKSTNPVLAEHVAAIRQLGKQTIANVIEVGRRLTKCKDIVGHRNFGCWLDREFGWSERTAQNFMRVFELSNSESENFADFNLPVSAIYLLAAPSTPKNVRGEVIERARAGEKIKHATVKEAITKGRSQPAQKGRSARGKTSSKAKKRNWLGKGKTKKTKQSASKPSLSPKDQKVLAKLMKAWNELKRELSKASRLVHDRFIDSIRRYASGEEDDTETELKPTQQDDQEMDGNDNNNDDLNDANDNDDDNDNDDEDNEQSNDSDWV